MSIDRTQEWFLSPGDIINLNHPLIRGVKGGYGPAFWYTGAVDFVSNIVSNFPSPYPGKTASTSMGLGINNGSANGRFLFSTPVGAEVTREYTIATACIGDPGTDPSGPINNDNGTSDRVFQHGSNLRQPRFIAFNTSGTPGIATSSLTPSADQYNAGWTQVGRIGSDQIPRVDIRLRSGEVGTGTAGAISGTIKGLENGYISVLTYNNGVTPWPGTLILGFIINRAWSEDETQSFLLDPFCMFEPAVRVTYNNSVATAGAGARSRTYIIP